MHVSGGLKIIWFWRFEMLSSGGFSSPLRQQICSSGLNELAMTACSIFRTKGAVEMHCVERTKDPCDDEFTALVGADDLSGLDLKLVWSGAR
jgi:hypothetical protein